jgi:hypothetical protein
MSQIFEAGWNKVLELVVEYAGNVPKEIRIVTTNITAADEGPVFRDVGKDMQADKPIPPGSADINQLGSGDSQFVNLEKTGCPPV